ncbi:hypothetical protein V8E53_011909 [Lactarius tabidus]
MPSHPTLQEQTLRVTPSQVMSIHSTLAARPTPSLEVSNAPVSLSSTSQEQTLGVTPHDVTHAVTSTTANTQLVLPSSSFTDLSQASPSPFSTNSSSRFDPQSSHGEYVLIHPSPPLETSLNVPSSLHLSPSQPPLGLTQDDSAPCSPPSPSTKRPFRVAPDDSVPATLGVEAAPPLSTVNSTSQQRSFEATPTSASPVPPISPHRQLELMPNNSQPSVLEVKPAPASSTTPSILQPHPFEVTSQVPMQHLAPQWLELQHPPLVHEDSSPLVLCHSHSSPLLPSTPARIKFALSLVTTAVLVLALANVSAIIPTRSRKLWRKNKEISNDRGDVTISGKTFDFAQLFQLVQYKPHAARLVFDPGGFTFAQQSPHEDAH